MKKPRPKKFSKLRKDPASTISAYDLTAGDGKALKDDAPAASAKPERPAGLESGAVCVSSSESFGSGYTLRIRQLGSELVVAAIDSARCGEHDRLVALTNAYVALVAADGRARA